MQNGSAKIFLQDVGLIILVNFCLSAPPVYFRETPQDTLRSRATARPDLEPRNGLRFGFVFGVGFAWTDVRYYSGCRQPAAVFAGPLCIGNLQLFLPVRSAFRTSRGAGRSCTNF